MYIAVILLQIVIVSPGTHLVKNDESQSRTIESQLKKTMSSLDFCNHTFTLRTDSKTLYYSLLKYKINILLLLQSTTTTK